MEETELRNASETDIDTIKILAAEEGCKAGNCKCPFFNQMSRTFTFCTLRNGRPCPCEGKVRIPETDTVESYKTMLLRILRGWDERRSATKSDFEPAMRYAAHVLGYEFKPTAFGD